MTDNNKTLIPALLAIGGSFAALPATAIELGDISVQSSLGQPLRASIAYALAPNERLADYCVTLANGPSLNGLPAVRNATLSVAGGVISLTGRAVVREPLMSVRVNISCPYTPRLSREYMLFINPALPVQSQPTASNDATVSTHPRATQSQSTRPGVATDGRSVSRRPAVDSAPIDATLRYRVQPGDSLSVIAQRIENRRVGLWNAVAKIFDANPHAFINNDPNRLKAGTWLDIPDLGGTTAVAAIEPGIEPVIEPVFAPAPAVVEAVVAVAPATTIDDTNFLEPATSPVVSDLRPGDLVVDLGNPSVEDAGPALDAAPAGVATVEADIKVTTNAVSPNVPTASIQSASTARPAPVTKSNWLIWMIGGGIALLAGLLFFGRRTRLDDGDPFAEPEAAHPMRRSSDSVTVETQARPEFDLDDDSPTDENPVLDLNLAMGTGLSDDTGVEVHEDFGYAALSELDFEFSDEDSASDSDEDTTGMPLATVTEIDATSKMPANRAGPGEVDDIDGDADVTQELSADDKTVEMPRSENDTTVEMTVESGKVDTKAG